MKNPLRTVALLAALLVLVGSDAGAQSQAGATANVTMVRGIVVSSTGDLQFGAVLARTGGTVTVSPAGARSITGAVVAMPAPFSPASFFVNDLDGKGNRKFAFTVQNASILLTRQGGSETMTVTTFTNDAIPCNPCSKTPASVRVGATLTVGSGQVAGTYVGTFTVRVDQQ